MVARAPKKKARFRAQTWARNRARRQAVSDQQENRPGVDLSRRNFLGVSSTALATAALAGLTAHAQNPLGTSQAEKDHSASDPGQENKPLLDETQIQTCLPQRIVEISVRYGIPSTLCTSAFRKAVGHTR
jgi:hypothetical protein